MSVCRWGITGYGVNIEKIYEYIDKEKVNAIVRKLIPDINLKEDDDVFEDNTFCYEPYSSFAEFLCEFDDKNIMTWDSDGDGGEYFLYKPKYPWEINNNDPKHIEEITEYIIRILQRVFSIPAIILRDYITYIDEVGVG